MPQDDQTNGSKIYPDWEPYQGQEDAETNPEAEQEMADVLESLGRTLLEKRNIAVSGRAASGVEQRWLEDEASFDGLDAVGNKRPMMDYVTGVAPPPGLSGSVEGNRSKIIANIARSKCETAAGRFTDILLPVDDRNWGLKVTPVPELSTAVKDESLAVHSQTGQPVVHPDGTPAMIGDVAKQEMNQAKEKMTAMETEIDDQLTECSFNGECRKVAWDAIKLGTGILKGPNVVKRIKQSWSKQEDETGTAMVMVAEEEMKPESKRVDPWNVYPDPDCGEDIKKAGYIWEYDTILPRDLKRLMGMDGYLDDQIKQVMMEDPIRTSVTLNASKQLEISRAHITKGANYERWEYNGELSRDDLEALGCDCSHDDVSPSLTACVVFVNDRPIKVVLNTLDTGELPYDFFQWSEVSNSIWGKGIVRSEYWWDKVLTGAWRAMMDNAGDSAGANIIIGKGVQPADGVMEITGKKIWLDDGESDDIRKAFNQFQIESTQEQLQKIIELALRFIDMETSLPMMFQGEKGEAPETLGATNIMVDANNIALRGRVKRWDDQITRPHIRRYYDWNMQYNEKDSIKGDYNVDARGASVLLARDNQNNALINAFKMKQDPDVAVVVDWKKAIRLYFNNQHLDVVKEDEEIKKAEAEKQKQVQAQQQQEQAKGQGQGDGGKAQASLQAAQIKAKADMDKTQAQIAHEKEMKMIDREIEMMKLSQAQGISLSDIKKELAIKQMELTTQKELSTRTLAVEAQKEHIRAAVKHPPLTPQVLKPPTEPVGQALPGEAWQA